MNNSKGIKRMQKIIVEREDILRTLLEDGAASADERTEAVLWLRDNAVTLLADYLSVAQLSLDAYPFVSSLNEMSKKNAWDSSAARSIADMTKEWIERIG